MLERLRAKWRMRRDKKMRKRYLLKNWDKVAVHRKLTKEQKREVQDFYKSMIGKRVSLYSHEYFYSRTGHWTKDYVPVDLYHEELLPRANQHNRQYAFGDKNMCDILFADENVVPSILKNINGYYYFEGRPVSEDEAIELCGNLKEIIIKPAKASHGKGVQLFDVQDGITTLDNKSIADLFKEYDKDFLLQHRIHQHHDLAILNPTSVNTLRILSYRSGMEVLIIYSVIRIGRKGAVIDNQSAGGISTTIDAKGRLATIAFGGFSEDNIGTTDTGVSLAGYQLPSYDKAIDLVKRLHLQLPFFDIVGWDVTILEDGEPALIEFNTNPGLSQSAFGSGMGEHTERIIRELWPRPNTWFHI